MKRLLLLPILICSATMAKADFTAGSQSVTVFGGWGGSSTQYDYEPGDKRAVTGGGGAFGVQYLYYLRGTPAIAIGPDLTWSANGDRQSDHLLSGYDTTARLKTTIGLITARLAFPRGIARPYIFGGIGAYHGTQQLSAQPQAGNQWPGGATDSRMLIDDSKTSAAIGSGIGIDFFPNDHFFLGVELRGVWLGGLDTDDNAAIRAAGYHVDDKTGLVQGNLFIRAGLKF